MKTLWNKWNDISLIKRILVFLIIGAILGVIFPNMDGTSPIAGIIILGSLWLLFWFSSWLLPPWRMPMPMDP